MVFAHHLLLKQGEKDLRRPSAYNNIRTKLRTVGRVLKKAEECYKISSMDSLLVPENFKKMTNCAREIVKENDQLGLTLGNYIKQLLLLKFSVALTENNEQKQKEVENCKYLFDAHWTSYISSVAGRRQRMKRLNIVDELPLTSDLNILTSYI